MTTHCWDKEGLKSFEDENETVLLKEQALAYADGTSIHGIKYTCEPGRTLLEKFIWITLCVCSIVLCSFLIQPIYSKWRTDPTFTTISSTDYPVWNLDFPAFTICPNVRVDPWRLDRLFAEKEWNATLKVLKMTPKELTGQIQRLLGMYIKYHEFDFSQPNTGYLNYNESVIIERHLQNFSSILKEAMPPCQSSIINCYWHGVETNCKDLFTVQSTDNGFCCSFNVIRQEALFGNKDSEEAENGDFFYDYYGSGDEYDGDYGDYGSDEESNYYYYNNYYYYQPFGDDTAQGSANGESTSSTKDASSGVNSPKSSTTVDAAITTAGSNPTTSKNGPTTTVDPNTTPSGNAAITSAGSNPTIF
ncbi:pickpocket protein 28-like [Tigriopus californicus]|uniref:pickpocket protein 28-like n=1 Tax=Tigriopus californicus TaxID=6832 RepID=UPI0027DA4738|nr:pickpocket protein 28-like [Tigriopus californicus]